MKNTFSQLRKQAKAAPKFVLKVKGFDFYLADWQELTGINLTSNIDQAQKYSVGFDDEKMKTTVWTLVLQRVSEDKSNIFEAVKINN